MAPTTTLDHHPTDADLRRIESELNCKVVSAAPMIDCNKCNGNTTLKETCDSCKGTGKVEKYYLVVYKVNETNRVGKGNAKNVKQQRTLY